MDRVDPRTTGGGGVSTPKAASPLFLDSAQEVPEPRRIPVERADDVLHQREALDVLITIQMSLEELVAGQRRMLAAFGTSSDSRSSVEVKTSTRGVDIASKSYDGSDVQAQVTPAVAAYFETLAAVQGRLNANAATS